MLTEAEIKKKLYGDYETASGAVHSSSHEIKMTGSAFSTAAAVPSATAPKHSFNASSPTIKIGEPTSRIPSSVFGDVPPPPRKLVPPVQRPEEWRKVSNQVGRAALGVTAVVLWKVSSFLIRALDFTLKLLDPRKPQARKLLYSIMACVLVIALFWGVFRLNAQRKKAMLGELSTTPVAAVESSKPEHISTSVNATDSNAKAVPAGESHQEILKTLDQSTSTTPAAAVDVAPPVGDGKYVIQVATYASIEDANRIIQSMQQSGFTAFYKKQIRNSTGHAFYPVYVGRFESSSKAQRTLNKFRKASIARPFQDAFIRTLD